jgi:hypothetical protein
VLFDDSICDIISSFSIEHVAFSVFEPKFNFRSFTVTTGNLSPRVRQKMRLTSVNLPPNPTNSPAAVATSRHTQHHAASQAYATSAADSLPKLEVEPNSRVSDVDDDKNISLGTPIKSVFREPLKVVDSVAFVTNITLHTCIYIYNYNIGLVMNCFETFYFVHCAVLCTIRHIFKSYCCFACTMFFGWVHVKIDLYLVILYIKVSAAKRKLVPWMEAEHESPKARSRLMLNE